MNYPEILSFGGGVNSAALAIMAINDGWRGEIVFSDTGCEWPETYCYIQYFEREFLSRYGISVVTLQPHEKSRGKGMSLLDYCIRRSIIPLASVRWCTQEWKIFSIDKYRGERTTMIAIAADEAHRQPDAIRPLVDIGIARKGCIEIIKSAGLDVPQKSGCYICPFQGNHQWRTLWERHPELFERVARLEESAQRKSTVAAWNATLDPKSKYTLRQRQLSYESQMTLPEIDMDELLEYKPCVCGV